MRLLRPFSQSPTLSQSVSACQSGLVGPGFCGRSLVCGPGGIDWCERGLVRHGETLSCLESPLPPVDSIEAEIAGAIEMAWQFLETWTECWIEHINEHSCHSQVSHKIPCHVIYWQNRISALRSERRFRYDLSILSTMFLHTVVKILVESLLPLLSSRSHLSWHQHSRWWILSRCGLIDKSETKCLVRAQTSVVIDYFLELHWGTNKSGML